MYSYISRGKKEWSCWSLPYIFGSRDLAGKIIIKMIINTMTQIRDKKANATQDQLDFEQGNVNIIGDRK